MSEVEFVADVFLLSLGLFTAGHIVGYHRGWQDGYWTLPDKETTDTGQEEAK